MQEMATERFKNDVVGRAVDKSPSLSLLCNTHDSCRAWREGLVSHSRFAPNTHYKESVFSNPQTMCIELLCADVCTAVYCLLSMCGVYGLDRLRELAITGRLFCHHNAAFLMVFFKNR